MELVTPNTVPSTTPTPTKRRGGIWRWVTAIGCIVIGIGIISYPFWPKLEYAFARKVSTFPYQTKLANADKINSSVTLSRLPEVKNKPTPKDNRLVIPSINIDMPIYEGANEKVLDRGGIWHIPKTSNPSIGSNTVLSGHRWQYLPPSNRTLYLLDKVKIGEPVLVYWQGVEYDFRITKREVVDPSRTDILNASEQPLLTIFTCTPLFSTKQRLVLYGELIS